MAVVSKALWNRTIVHGQKTSGRAIAVNLNSIKITSATLGRRSLRSINQRLTVLLGSGLIERWQADAVTVTTGEQRRIVLSDGSAVTLNTDTALAFNTIGEQRGVKILSGEAYFEVQPDKTRPFVVETEQGTVRVVGTRFSVKTGDATQVDVESGIVVCAGQHRATAANLPPDSTPASPAKAFPQSPTSTLAELSLGLTAG